MKNNFRQHRKVLSIFAVYWFFLWIYAFWSYALVDPNLTLVSHPMYLNLVSTARETLLSNRQFLALIFVTIVSVSWVCYVLLAWSVRSLSLRLSAPRGALLLLGYLIFVLPLVFAYNALSHDVFNYIFNARMVVEYGANPHIQTALDFSQDEWVRFMHNTHTAAPYWYGWTAASLAPYLIGLGKFFTTWLSFKLFALLSLVGLLVVAGFALFDRSTNRLPILGLVLLAANPLILIEIVGNAHNDLWMMLPVIIASILLLRRSAHTASRLILSFLLFGFSISIKYATAILIPIYSLLVVRTLYWHYSCVQSSFRQLRKRVPVLFSNLTKHQLSAEVFLLMSISMFLLLFLPRSRWFLPWYLTWSLVFLPFIFPTLKRLAVLPLRSLRYYWVVWLLGFSLAALLRYYPWLRLGTYTPQVLSDQIVITWAGGILTSILLIIALLWVERRTINHEAKT